MLINKNEKKIYIVSHRFFNAPSKFWERFSFSSRRKKGIPLLVYIASG